MTLFEVLDKVCPECEDTNKKQPISGMIIINNMVASDSKLIGGAFLDFKNEKNYKYYIGIDASNSVKLIVSGSLNKSRWLGYSQI